MKKFAMILTLISIVVIGIILGGVYFYFTAPVGGNHSVSFEVKKGETFSSIGSRLQENKVIKSSVFYKLYVKMNHISPLSSGVYALHSEMSVSEIVKVLSTKQNVKAVRITFKEGRNMRYIVSQLTKNLDMKENDIYTVLKDQNYLNELKKKYWFITDDVKNANIYYSLEGYLYPDTYDFKENATVKEIFEKMLNNTHKKLAPYKESIEKSGYTVHQILTLASVTELEASTYADRQGVAGVFFNRLKGKMALGSDVTTYYAAKIDMGERDLYKAEINDYNHYNTRNANMAGKLPIGPICNPSILSVKAVLNPTSSTNYYFVADKNKKVYFTKNYAEHNKIIESLKKQGLWFTY